jgi:hypothetical protein
MPSTPLPNRPAALLCSRCAFMGHISLVSKIRSRQRLLQQSLSTNLWPPCTGVQPLRARSWFATFGGKISSSPFAGLDSKIGKAPTMLNLEAAGKDRDFVSNGRTAINLNPGRSQSWTVGDGNVSDRLSLTCPLEVDLVDSPTPSLAFSYGSSAMNQHLRAHQRDRLQMFQLHHLRSLQLTPPPAITADQFLAFSISLQLLRYSTSRIVSFSCRRRYAQTFRKSFALALAL